LHLDCIPEAAIMQIAQFNPLLLEHFIQSLEYRVSLWRSMWQWVITDILHGTSACTVQILCFSYGNSYTLLLKYPAKCTLLVQRTAKKFTDMFFLRLSFKMCKLSANINRCCASCKDNLQDYQALLISEGLCFREDTSRMLWKWVIKKTDTKKNEMNTGKKIHFRVKIISLLLSGIKDETVLTTDF